MKSVPAFLLSTALLSGGFAAASAYAQTAPAPATAPSPAQEGTVEGVTATAKKRGPLGLTKPGADAPQSATCEFLVATDPFVRAQMTQMRALGGDPRMGPTMYLPTRANRNPDYKAPPTTAVGSPAPVVGPAWKGLTDTTGNGINASMDAWSNPDTGGVEVEGADDMWSAMRACRGSFERGGASRRSASAAANRDTTLPTALALFDQGRYAESLDWFHKAYKKLPDNDGGDEAALMIGKIYLLGLGEKVDAREAVVWLSKSAGAPFNAARQTPVFDPKQPDLNTAMGEAALLLARIHLTGFGGVAKNPDLALKWYRRASEVGHVPAAKTLGDIYYYGYDRPRDPKKALGYYKQAATLGYAPAQYAMAEMYYLGEAGSAADRAQALAWYNEAAKLEHPDALYALAVAYDTGDGVAADPQKALGFYKQAALGGNTAAQCAMGTYFYEGKLLPKDDATARKWFESAAIRGDADAMFNLAAMQMKGEGGAVDRVKAWVWFKLADSRKKENAAAAVAVLERRMTAAERQAAADILTPKQAG